MIKINLSKKLKIVKSEELFAPIYMKNPLKSLEFNL